MSLKKCTILIEILTAHNYHIVHIVENFKICLRTCNFVLFFCFVTTYILWRLFLHSSIHALYPLLTSIATDWIDTYVVDTLTCYLLPFSKVTFHASLPFIALQIFTFSRALEFKPARDRIFLQNTFLSINLMHLLIQNLLFPRGSSLRIDR